MKTTGIAVQKEFCVECSLALTRFIGKMEGVDSVEADNGRVLLTFDESKISEDDLLKITRDSIEKLGYKIISPEQ